MLIDYQENSGKGGHLSDYAQNLCICSSFMCFLNFILFFINIFLYHLL